MSEIFGDQRTPETMRAGLTTLARLAHRAEDTDDDLLLLAVVDEIAARGRLAEGIYRDEYIRLMRERRCTDLESGV
jgi:hypothetical protein